MSTLPALPDTPQDQPPSEENTIRSLTRFTGTSLSLHQSTTGEWILVPANDLTASALREGLSAFDEAMQGGPQRKISDAIAELIGATDRPPQLGDEAAVARVEALKQMAWEYPLDVIQAACRQWRRVPNYGRWWPTEQDLRAHCEAFVKSRRDLRAQAARLLSALETQEKRKPRERSLQPYGATKAFVDRVREHPHLGQPFVRSYLSDLACDFTDDTILVAYSMQVERIRQRCADLLREFPGVRIVQDRQTTERCNRDQDAMGNTFTPQSQPKRKWNT